MKNKTTSQIQAFASGKRVHVDGFSHQEIIDGFVWYLNENERLHGQCPEGYPLYTSLEQAWSDYIEGLR